MIGIKAVGRVGKLVGARSMHDFRSGTRPTNNNTPAEVRAAAAAADDDNDDAFYHQRHHYVINASCRCFKCAAQTSQACALQIYPQFFSFYCGFSR